jgi:hypothetical protein
LGSFRNLDYLLLLRWRRRRCCRRRRRCNKSCNVKRTRELWAEEPDRCGDSCQNQQRVNGRCSGQEGTSARVILTVPLRLD